MADGQARSWARTRSKLVPRPAAALACALCLSSAGASDLPFLDVLPVVASVSRLPQQQADAPTAVTVIDRDMLRASAARTLSDVMRLVPGFQTYALSDKPARVAYHGVTDDSDFSPRVQVLVDGRSLHSPLFRGGMNWELVPVALEDIERIEVVRGSNTTSYGTNAFLGVVNIITIDPALAKGTSLIVGAGNQGVRDVYLSRSGQLSDGVDYRLSFKQMRDDGLNESSVSREDADWQDRNRTRLFDFAVNLQLDPRTRFELGLGRVEGSRLVGRWDKDGSGLPVAGLYKPDDPVRDAEQSSSWLQMRWLRSLSETADLSVRYSHSVDEADSSFVDPGLMAPFSRVDLAGDRGTRHELEVVNTLLPVEDIRLAWGASWRWDSLRSDTQMRGKGTVSRDVGRVFANLEWKPSHWLTGNLGLSHEHDSLAGSKLAPRASVSVHLLPGHTVRLGYARAWRSAGTLDYEAWRLSGPGEVEAEGNASLSSERLDSWDLGYLGRWPAWRASLDVRLFDERISDRHHQRISITAGAPDTVQALEDLRIRGHELQLRWQPVDTGTLVVGHANVRIRQSLNDAGYDLVYNCTTGCSNFKRSIGRYTELAEQSAPRNATSLLWLQRLPHDIELSVVHYWIGAIKWSRNTVTERYERTDLRLAKALRLDTLRGELAYTVQSLNGAHSEERMQRVVDRRHWVSLRVDF